MKNLLITILFISIFITGCAKKEEKPPTQQAISPQTEKPKLPETKPVAEIKEDPKPIITETIKDTTPTQKPVQIEQPEPETKEELSNQDLWQKYRDHREASKVAFNESDFHEAMKNLKLAAKYAEELNRDDLAAWQYNNIGYYSILEFKGRTNYDFRTNKIRTIIDEKEKETFVAETKQIFEENLKILTDAQEYLEKAYKIDEKYDEQSRTDKIYSNLKFIDWVKNFLNN